MIPRKSKKSIRPAVFLVLENVRSSHNVGAIFRTAEAAGVEKIFLVGYTPLPVDQFGRANPEIAKTALGAERFVPWKHSLRMSTLAKRFKKEGVVLIALEQTSGAIDYKKYIPKKLWALVVGNEVVGVEKKTIALCDAVVEIPMRGRKESLNVSVAAGIALFRLSGV